MHAVVAGYACDSSDGEAFTEAIVKPGSPTLKRAKRRTLMFSPSLATFCAMSWPMVSDCSLMNGCSSRQTSS